MSIEKGRGEALPKNEKVDRPNREIETVVASLDKVEKKADELAQQARESGNERASERIRQLAGEHKDVLAVYVRALLMGGCLLLASDIREVAEETPEQRHERARLELERDGITREQASTRIPGINTLVYRAVQPYGYQFDRKMELLVSNVLSGREMASDVREDAWRLYLGFPQEHETFGISDYMLDAAKDGYCYKINGFWEDYLSELSEQSPSEFVQGVVLRGETGTRIVYGDDKIMGGFTFGSGQDEKGSYIFYTDLWDLAVPLEDDEDGFLGKPYYIHDRQYFDPQTFEPIVTKSR